MKNRIEIQKLENGYEVEVWEEEKEDSSNEEMMYPTPKKYVAKTKEEAIEILTENID